MTKHKYDIFQIHPEAKRTLEELSQSMGETLTYFLRHHYYSVLKHQILLDNDICPTINDKVEILDEALSRDLINQKDYENLHLCL